MIINDLAPSDIVQTMEPSISPLVIPAKIYRKGFKFRLYPTKEQKVLLDKHFSGTRAAYNIMLYKAKEHYKLWKRGFNVGKPLTSAFDFNYELTKLKQLPEYAWLSKGETNVERIIPPSLLGVERRS